MWPLQRQQWVLLCNCLVGALPYSHYVMRSFPLCGVRVLHPAQYDLLDNVHGDRQKKNVPWFSSSRSDWHVLQRRCQPANPPTPIYIQCFTVSVPTEANYDMHIYFPSWRGRGGGGGHQRRSWTTQEDWAYTITNPCDATRTAKRSRQDTYKNKKRPKFTCAGQEAKWLTHEVLNSCPTLSPRGPPISSKHTRAVASTPRRVCADRQTDIYFLLPLQP